MQSVAKVLHNCQMEIRLTMWKHACIFLPDLHHDAQCADAQSMQWHYVTRSQYTTASTQCLAGLSRTLIVSVCLQGFSLLCICVHHNSQEHISCKHAARGQCEKGAYPQQAIELREVTWS